MDEMGIGLIALMYFLGSTALTSIIGLLLKRSFDKHYEKRDKELAELAELREHKAHDERECLKQEMKAIVETAIEPIKQDLIIIKKGTQAGLRHDLAMMADEWLVKGYCPRNVKDDFENIYRQYHTLGKNGVMDSIYQSILNLPESKPKPKTTSSTKKPTTTKKVATILNE